MTIEENGQGADLSPVIKPFLMPSGRINAGYLLARAYDVTMERLWGFYVLFIAPLVLSIAFSWVVQAIALDPLGYLAALVQSVVAVVFLFAVFYKFWFVMNGSDLKVAEAFRLALGPHRIGVLLLVLSGVIVDSAFWANEYLGFAVLILLGCVLMFFPHFYVLDLKKPGEAMRLSLAMTLEGWLTLINVFLRLLLFFLLFAVGLSILAFLFSLIDSARTVFVWLTGLIFPLLLGPALGFFMTNVTLIFFLVRRNHVDWLARWLKLPEPESSTASA